MKKNKRIKFMKTIYIFLMFTISYGFAQEPANIIGFAKRDNTQVSLVPDTNSKYEKFKVQKTDSLEISTYTYDFPAKYTLFWRIKFKGQSGYISNYDISQSNELISLKKTIDEIKENEQRKMESIRFAELKNLWGAKIAQRIVNKDYWIGMTAEMCKKSLGSPKDINTSAGSWGVHEQWIYDKPYKMYLYFDNKKLTSYQF